MTADSVQYMITPVKIILVVEHADLVVYIVSIIVLGRSRIKSSGRKSSGKLTPYPVDVTMSI